MEETSERHIIQDNFINEAEYYGHLMHLISYQFATKYTANKIVLDYGSGSGYGSNILAKNAKQVIGIDINAEVVNFAHLNYSLSNLEFKIINDLKSDNFQNKFDVITSFQVIEHVLNEKEYLNDIKRLLKPDGYFILTTPNSCKRLFSNIQKPWNKFHIKEYSEKQINQLLKKYFNSVELLNISANKDFLAHELIRLKKQKYTTLPFTLIIYPRIIRLFLLNFQKILFGKLIKIKNFIRNKKSIDIENRIFKSKFSIDDMLIDKNLIDATDLLVICKL